MTIPWGPVGEAVYKRTYSREVSPGVFETWPQTVRRVAEGNMAFVYGDKSLWSPEVISEYQKLVNLMDRFAVIPAGRQLNATGVPGRQYLFNCHVAGWGPDFSEHFKFTFMRLVEGGGVGANYSTKHIEPYGPPTRRLSRLSFSCKEDHKDIEKLRGYLTDRKQGVYFRVRDTREGWADALAHLIDITTDGCSDTPVDIVFDVSDIRAEGSPLVSSGGVAAGPLPLVVMLATAAEVLNRGYDQGYFTPVDVMEIDHAIAVGAVAGGKRRSARMSICRWDDPYVMDFIHAKRDGRLHWSTNISVEIDSEFTERISKPGNRKHTERDYIAKAVHAAVCDAVLENGEPGYWNSELSQIGETGTIIATNPCGEIPLEPWESCNLGHVNLEAFVDYENASGVDYGGLQEAHKLMTRFLIRSTYADINDPKQRLIQDRNRRIGVGHFGVQGFLNKRGIRYSDAAHSVAENGIMSFAGQIRYLAGIVRKEARDYAFELRIPEPVKVTCVAPTGSIAKLPGVTEGIHPVIYKWYDQRIRFSKRDEREFAQVLDYMSQGFDIEDDIYDPSGMTSVVVIPTENVLIAQVRELVKTYDLDFDESVVESAEDLTLEDMLAFQSMYQEFWADNAVSYTCNIPEGTVSPEDLQGILKRYLPRLKGTTIMVNASREQAPYTRITEDQYLAATAKRIEDSADFECSSGACGI
jgi:ribonucleoside-triphosphate reductase (thioredoxin)